MAFSNNFTEITLLLATIILWGTAPIFDKAALRQADPMLGTILRGIFIGIIMFFTLIFSGKTKQILLLSHRTIFYFLVSGIFAGILGVFTYFKLLQSGPTSKIVPLAATYPLITAILSVAVLGEQLTLTRFAGIILIVAGIMLVK
jgi:bacterial/archaeal transporter family protein